MLELYGIPNCDTVRKARKWMQIRDINYRFHDYKKEGADVCLLTSWVEQIGWQVLLNRRGTTWRKLPDDEKANMDQAIAVELMSKHPSLIKRPVLVSDEFIEVGFSEQRYLELLV